MWRTLRLAILSTDPSRGTFNPFTGTGDHAAAHNGKLQIIDLDNDASDPIDLEIKNWPEGLPLHPLGIDVLELRADEALLGVVNMTETRCAVELVRLHAFYKRSSPNGRPSIHASHIASFAHPSLTSPNAVVVLSETSVLCTNSFSISPRTSLLANKVEQLLAIPGGSVKLLTCSSGETTCRTLVRGIPLANGLALNRNKDLLAVASTTGSYVAFYDVKDLERGVLSLRSKVQVGRGFLVDNLHFVDDVAGEVLLCAGHPSAMQYLKLAKAFGKGGVTAPSRVVKITIPSHSNSPAAPGTKDWISSLFSSQGSEAQTVFESAGGFFRTSSTAVAYTAKVGKQNMLVCGLWQDGVLKCEDVHL